MFNNNFTKFLFLFFALTIPAFGCAMESGDVMEEMRMAHWQACLDEDSDIGSWPRAIMGAVKDITVYGVETAMEHPVVALACGSGLCLLAVWKNYVATGKDLKKVNKKLNNHRTTERARVDVVKEEHDGKTKQNLALLFDGNKVIAGKFGKAGTALGSAGGLLQELFKEAGLLENDMGKALDVSKLVVQDTSEQGIVYMGNLDAMQKDADALDGHQASVQGSMVLFVQSLDTAKADLKALLEQLCNNGKFTVESQNQLASLLSQFKTMDQLRAAMENGNGRIQLLEDKDGNNNNNKEEE